jgi:ParB family transcriptional regulator, chromosome partitioning protein
MNSAEHQLCLSEEFLYNQELKTENLTNQWYTPIEIINKVKKVFGGEIDLDPASCAEANKVVGALDFYDEQQNGLTKNWFGNVFLNPPYSSPLIGHFCEKSVNEWFINHTKSTIILLKEGATNAWFRPLRNQITCYLDQRVKFVDGTTGKVCEHPRSGHCMVYLGENKNKFVEIMSENGFAYFPNWTR